MSWTQTARPGCLFSPCSFDNWLLKHMAFKRGRFQFDHLCASTSALCIATQEIDHEHEMRYPRANVHCQSPSSSPGLCSASTTSLRSRDCPPLFLRLHEVANHAIEKHTYNLKNTSSSMSTLQNALSWLVHAPLLPWVLQTHWLQQISTFLQVQEYVLLSKGNQSTITVHLPTELLNTRGSHYVRAGLRRWTSIKCGREVPSSPSSALRASTNASILLGLSSTSWEFSFAWANTRMW